MQMPLPVALYLNKEKRLLVCQVSVALKKTDVYIIKLDAHGDLLRGLQVVETAAGITSTLLGDKIEG